MTRIQCFWLNYQILTQQVFSFVKGHSHKIFVCQSEFLSFLKSVFRIQIHWIQIWIQKICWVRILIQAIAESGSKQRFLITFFIPKPSYIISPTKDIQALGNPPTKRELFKHEIFFIFSFFWDNFGLPGPRFRSADPYDPDPKHKHLPSCSNRITML